MRIIFLLAFLCPYFSNCQPLPITGQVLSEDLQPIAGATVVLKRTGATVITKSDGGFSFPSSTPADTLVVSAVGYTTAYIRNNERGKHTIILKTKDAELETVVINTGYQRLPKERITGSFAVIDEKLLRQQAGMNIISRLEGVTSSVLFDKHPNRPEFTIRGVSTINGPKAPLIILDDFPYESDISTINPDDVESITILKDAAASSVWGTRAGNGVIVITSKKARREQPLSVSFTTNSTWRQKPDLNYLREMKSTDFIDLEKFLFSKGYYNSKENNSNRPVLSPVVEILIRQRQGSLSPEEAENLVSPYRSHNLRDDYSRYIYQSGINTQNTLSLVAGSKSLAWNMSAGYTKNISELAETYSRFTLNNNSTLYFSDNYKLELGLAYTHTGSVSGRPSYNSITVNSTERLYPYTFIAGNAGDPLPVYTYRQPYIDTAGGGSLLDWKYYPLTDYRYNTSKLGQQNLVGKIGFNARLFRFFSFDLKYQLEKQTAETDNHQQKESYATRNLVNRFTQLNRTTGSINYIIPNAGILDKSYADLTAQNIRTQLNFNRRDGRHQISAITGAEVRQTIARTSGFRLYGYDDDVMSTVNMDFVSTYPTYFTGSKQSIPNAVSLSEKTLRFLSFYGNMAYTYGDRYTVTASARRDASNLFGLATNDKWNPLWSAGLAWNITKEEFYRADWPHLNLRATYGFSGNIMSSMSAVTTIRYLTAPITNYPYATLAQYADPELRWEASGMLNFGLDFSNISKCISGSIEYYTKKGTDLFGIAPVDYTVGTGGRTITKNYASMRTNGWDLTLATINLNRQVRWSTNILFSYSRNKITDLYLTSTSGSSFISEGTLVSRVPGQPVYALASYKWGGLNENGDPQTYLNGQLSTDYNMLGSSVQVDDLEYSGTTVPPFFGSVSNSISWKGLTASFLLSFKFGHKFKRESINYTGLISQNKTHSDYALRWQKPGDELNTSVPAFVYPVNSARVAFYVNSSALVTPADLVRLNYINFSYEFKPKKPGLPVWQLFTVLSDAGLVWRANKFSLDPDYGSSLPPAPAITIGIKTIFK